MKIWQFAFLAALSVHADKSIPQWVFIAFLILAAADILIYFVDILLEIER